MKQKPLLHLLGVRHPIVQAPMIGVATPNLAAAVTNAGGLGSLGLGASTPEQAKELIDQTRALTGGPLNTNLFCHQSAKFDRARNDVWIKQLSPFFEAYGGQAPTDLKEVYRSFLTNEEMLITILRERPEVVSFHFGLPPAEWLQALKQRGIATLACATSVEEAHLVEAAGIDAIILQGIEAGGHRGVFDHESGGDTELGLFTLLRLVASEVKLPLIAAGGIMDGAGIRAAMDLGASGVQMGTAFLGCPESSTSSAHRDALQTKRAYGTRMTRGISGRPARGLPNKLFYESLAEKWAVAAEFPLAYDLSKQLNVLAAKSGSTDFVAQWAGQGAPLIRELPASKLIETLVSELNNF
ncbi:NAD(P)H-dependent flavin oxidoreductase [Pseudomonas sp. NPDC087804]|uniref:NAD(P)H-dependent flavin oxidoreductase n=1 Tax=Pseudomonas sp. NPDC087804 TaxID=3364449 RepID=UPI00382D9530